MSLRERIGNAVVVLVLVAGVVVMSLPGGFFGEPEVDEMVVERSKAVADSLYRASESERLHSDSLKRAASLAKRRKSSSGAVHQKRSSSGVKPLAGPKSGRGTEPMRRAEPTRQP